MARLVIANPFNAAINATPAQAMDVVVDPGCGD